MLWMSSVELLIPLSKTTDSWSIARVVVAKEAEIPFLERFARFGLAHYPTGVGRAIVMLFEQHVGLFDELHAEGAEVVEHDDYDASWRHPAEPVRLAGGVDVVAPSSTASPSAKRIVLSPGLAFGDCRHPTTRLCASVIAERAKKKPLTSLLDVGCGSGVLALVGHRLGASTIVATDIDPYSRFVARENARRNGVDLDVTHPIPEGRTFDVVVANVWPSAFPQLAPSLLGALAPDAILIVSGFHATEVDAVREVFGDRPWSSKTDNGWAALVLTQ
jgi:ribosomal protein L11 methyltransferase